MLRETTSRGLCGLVCPLHTGTREPGTLTLGGALFLVPLVWESNPELCVFITAVPITDDDKLFAGGGYWRTCAMRDDDSRPV